jgi:hypothetical protein
MKDLLEGIQHFRVLGIDEGRGGDDVVGRGVVLSRARTAAALVSAISTRVDAGTMTAARGAAVSRVRTAASLMSARSTSVDAGTMAAAGGGGGGASVGGVDGSRGENSGGGRGRDLHVNEGVGDVVDAVLMDGGRVLLERVHAASHGREGEVRRVVTLPS